MCRDRREAACGAGPGGLQRGYGEELFGRTSSHPRATRATRARRRLRSRGALLGRAPLHTRAHGGRDVTMASGLLAKIFKRIVQVRPTPGGALASTPAPRPSPGVSRPATARGEPHTEQERPPCLLT